jgi:hypothetical protein
MAKISHHDGDSHRRQEVGAPVSNECHPLTAEDHNEPSTRRRAPLLACLSHLSRRLRRQQFVHFSSSPAGASSFGRFELRLVSSELALQPGTVRCDLQLQHREIHHRLSATRDVQQIEG